MRPCNELHSSVQKFGNDFQFFFNNKVQSPCLNSNFLLKLKFQVLINYYNFKVLINCYNFLNCYNPY